MSGLKALLINCSLKKEGEKSSTEAMLQKAIKGLEAHRVKCTSVWATDHNIPFGVQTDMGKGDDWPKIHKLILGTDILIIGTPIWLGQRGSVCQMVLERMDAMFGETNADGQLPLYNKVAGVCVVGNEDGVQHVGASVLYNLMQMGATIPPNAESYWIGAAGARDDFVDVALDDEYVAKEISSLTNNLVYVAQSLKATPIPAKGNLVESS